MIIDFHSHILPAIDDGAKDIDSSLEMLRLSRKMGVDKILATSHCYPYSSSDIDKFIEKRNLAYSTLVAGADEDIPNIVIGAEVHLATDISRFKNVKKLCIEGTRYMLVEMPASSWNESVVERVYNLTLRGITPIIAHAERNMSQKKELLNSLYSFDVLIQINAESFGNPKFKKFIDRMMGNAMLHVVGSDMHNTSLRPPNMDKALKYIKRRYGAECIEYLMNNAETIMSGEKLSYRELKAYKKKSLFG